MILNRDVYKFFVVVCLDVNSRWMTYYYIILCSVDYANNPLNILYYMPIYYVYTTTADARGRLIYCIILYTVSGVQMIIKKKTYMIN